MPVTSGSRFALEHSLQEARSRQELTAVGHPWRLVSAEVTRTRKAGPSTGRQVAHHIGKLGSPGFEVTLCRIPEPDPDGPGQTQPA